MSSELVFQVHHVSDEISCDKVFIGIFQQDSPVAYTLFRALAGCCAVGIGRSKYMSQVHPFFIRITVALHMHDVPGGTHWVVTIHEMVSCITACENSCCKVVQAL
jgi:hypothetical protein